MASNEAAAEREERLKSALWYAIGQFVDDECINRNLNATPRFIGALTELVYTQIANTSRDLETFSKHGGRRVINTDDVMLLTRRNEGLEEVLKKELDRLRAEEGRGADAQPKKRGRPSGAGVAKGKGKAKQ
ncbi:kinetochore component CENP-S-domain-containing protein [Massariosphaeria phaeospora]|uniref:Kinetochore component CENP-S-domain-containing protein n=1 Tax=Massariosphaeria phaeospora TaxID=100035 RepID=A0A7C8M1L3_9PLEO|nr:kinetochore component CENP-S-domain-containing protein [Massariosphaeria phaeospora]